MGRFLSFALSCLLGFSSLEGLSSDAMMTVDSDFADYDGESLYLKGHVFVEHGIGQLSAESAILTQSKEESRHPLENVDLHKGIYIELVDGASLRCETAKINYLKLHGALEGGKHNPYVIYHDLGMSKENGRPRTPLSLSSLKMQLKLNELPDDTQELSHSVDTISADGDVKVQYDNRYILSSDEAVYQRKTIEPTKENPWPGLITLKSKNGLRRCHLKRDESDSLFATKITVDSSGKRIHLDNVDGSVRAQDVIDHVTQIHFESQTAYWDQIENFIELKKNVKVSLEGIGKLSTHNKVELHYTEKDDVREFTTIQSIGDTSLTYFDPTFNQTRKMHCYEAIHIDNQSLEATLLSPQTPNGMITPRTTSYLHRPFRKDPS